MFATELLPPTAAPSEGGITLLEAYSALARRNGSRPEGLEVPSPGQPTASDADGRFWAITLRNVG